MTLYSFVFRCAPFNGARLNSFRPSTQVQHFVLDICITIQLPCAPVVLSSTRGAMMFVACFARALTRISSPPPFQEMRSRERSSVDSRAI